ncbi:MAG: hypothetical protein ACKV19_03810 [Verrucomicrobiales bacterium]
MEWLVRVWWKLADRLSAQSPSLPGCHGRRVLAADGTTVLVWSYLNFSLLPSRGVDLIVRTKYAAKID